LEQKLNDNLQALAGSKNFEDTVMSLAATIHLLNSRLAPSIDSLRRVDLGGPSDTGQAHSQYVEPSDVGQTNLDQDRAA
jgi:hypothetical protein